MMSKIRLQWLDIAKGVLLYFVIWGHIVIYNGMVFKFIFAFHMPAFFILSGYTLSVKDIIFSAFIKKKYHSLLLPY